MSQFGQNRHAVEQRHRQIEDHHIRFVLFDSRERLDAVAGLNHFISRILKTSLNERSDIGFIINDQHLCLLQGILLGFGALVLLASHDLPGGKRK